MKPSRYGYLAGLVLLVPPGMANAGECICSIVDTGTGVEIVPRHYLVFQPTNGLHPKLRQKILS